MCSTQLNRVLNCRTRTRVSQHRLTYVNGLTMQLDDSAIVDLSDFHLHCRREWRYDEIARQHRVHIGLEPPPPLVFKNSNIASTAATRLRLNPRPPPRQAHCRAIAIHVEVVTTISPAPIQADRRILELLDNEDVPTINWPSVLLNEFTMFLFLIIVCRCVVAKHSTC